MVTFTPETGGELWPTTRRNPRDMVPQADKQAHTEIAEREGKQGEQARVINREEAEKRKDR
jgi:hypothetical protein